MVVIAVVVAFASGFGGLLLSYHLAAPSGPAIILVAGLIYLISLAFGPVGGLRRRFAPGRHLEA
jgi:zinc/manganese transport system permease protein